MPRVYLHLELRKSKKVYSNCSGSQVRALSISKCENVKGVKKTRNAHPVKKMPDAVSNVRAH